ncbi:MAG: tetratricopeptide repeat protein, partial [Bryobacteraceae bacterium]
ARALRETLLADPLDQWARRLESGTEPVDNRMRLDLAFDYARAALYEDAVEVLSGGDFEARDGSAPMLLYALGHFANAKAAAWRAKAAGAPPDYCFPSRLEEMQILEAALRAAPKDARAPYYLGNLLYDRRRYEEALSLWQRSSELDSSFPTVWRNLGIAYFNIAKDSAKALFAFDQALAADAQDARILYERDQLWKRTGKPPRERLQELERFSSLVQLRDDLSAEIATLHNDTSQPERALAVLTSRKFQPWEGGEGIALGQYARAQVMLGRRALVGDHFDIARDHFDLALTSPENLGEAQHLLSNRSKVYYWLGVACEAAGDRTSARHWWQRAAASKGDFQQMSVKPFSEMSYYSGKALKRLGAPEEAEQLFRDLLRYAQQLARQKATIDYFATSLPHLLLFDEDLNRTTAIASKFLEAQARIGLSEAGGERLLQEVLAADPNHHMAIDFQDEIRCEYILQGAG